MFPTSCSNADMRFFRSLGEFVSRRLTSKLARPMGDYHVSHALRKGNTFSFISSTSIRLDPPRSASIRRTHGSWIHRVDKPAPSRVTAAPHRGFSRGRPNPRISRSRGLLLPNRLESRDARPTVARATILAKESLPTMGAHGVGGMCTSRSLQLSPRNWAPRIGRDLLVTQRAHESPAAPGARSAADRALPRDLTTCEDRPCTP